MLHHAGPGPRTPSRARHARILPAALACALMATACGGRGGDRTRDDDARPGGAGVTVSYREADQGDEAHLGFLRQRRLPEQVADDLNRTLRLPRRIGITGRSCDEDDVPDYDPETGRVTLCYGYVGEVRAMFREARDPDVAGRTAGVITETLYHEVAHALIDRLDLRFTGHEEDVADQFAAYRLLARGAAGRAALRAAADNYAQYAADSGPGSDDPSDEHAPDAVRSANYLCYLYGSAPERERKLVDGKRLGKERAEQCEDEYRALRRGWDGLLTPYATGRTGPPGG
ncbi:DUF4344 domain-containing metallopeptidase [Streptomyces sp. I05A-00742]|uniref:DUF4344 domain-containing metallopeptidase n=1 Tax=Streptomyces sp. I05A-00742 TaxID=2732853 RepID=UPI001489DC61|nr:DUF4344 domain-containing metallopeptidase [Streptomyces sp. I05A-00742]